nr:SCP extracellular domain containing protein [Haemonchus contortus]
MLIYSVAVLFLALQDSSGLKIYRSNVTECGNQGTMVYTVRRTFLEELNEIRASLAKGTVPSFPEAANMRFMAYDCNLEEEAIKLTATCDRFEDGTQSNRKRINVASFEWEGNGVIKVAKKAVAEWWDKKPHTWDKSQKITENDSMPFFLIAQAETDRVGCSVKICEYTHYNVACIFEKEAKVGHNLYEEGTACTDCAGHCYQKLCNATTSVQQ